LFTHMSKRAKPATVAILPPEDFARFAGNPDFVLSLARGLRVIEAFEGHTGGISPSEIAKHTGFSRAAVRRLLVTLEALGYARTDGRTYALSTAVLKLGFSYLSSSSLPALAQPMLERISEDIHESVSVSVLEGDEIVYIARASTKRVMSIGLSVGSRLPAYCTSMGRVLLATLPDAKLVSYLNRVDLKAVTPKTITNKDLLRDVIRNVASTGFALTDEELELGLRSVAVPVRGRHGNIMAAMNIGVSAARVSQSELIEKFLPTLRRHALLLGNVVT
jgi:IclR family transcriptional regulator, pca regulon regulatory protein